MQTTADGDVRGMNGRCFCRHSSAQCSVYVWPKIHRLSKEEPGGQVADYFRPHLGEISAYQEAILQNQQVCERM
jgi:hypothetical protein